MLVFPEVVAFGRVSCAGSVFSPPASPCSWRGLCAEERYYLLIFTAQAEPNLPRTSHTFAAFVHASADQRQVEGYCISWMPKSLEIESTHLHPVEGVNLNLSQTFKWVRSVGGHVTLLGPYVIRKELYDLAAKQVERLDRGELRDILFDRRNRGKDASNCIHAVADLDTTQSPLHTGAKFGNDTGEPLYEYFRRYILPNTESTRWLTDRLNITSKDVRFATQEK